MIDTPLPALPLAMTVAPRNSKKVWPFAASPSPPLPWALSVPLATIVDPV
ncbi:MAG: hypothetical protein RLN69_05035 [Woeseiaceae bacterium]